MKTRTRISALAAAVVASVMSIFVAAPAFATGNGSGDSTQFSTAGQPVDVVAISIVGLVLLAVILIGSTLLGNLFERNNKN